MFSIGIIAEGRTDQIIIENVLVGYLQSYDFDINELQPLRDETDEQRGQNFGGWYKVFEYCQSSNFRAAFQFNDFIIIQIDTDKSEEVHYDVPKRTGSKIFTELEMIEEVKNKFIEVIGSELYEILKDKIIFAIAVESTECWLLPLYFNDKRKGKIVNCLQTLRSKVKLTNKKGEKLPREYDKVSSQYCKNKILKKMFEHNPSFKVFIENLDKQLV